MARKWIYDLTIHSAVGLIGTTETENPSRANVDEAGNLRVISCDQQGQCFYDDVIRPNSRPLLDLLNRRGAEGWELVQYNYHSGHLYLLWKREV